MAPPDDVRSTLNAYVQARPYAAIALATIDNGNVRTYLVSGSKAARIDERTRFQIGSVTKTFTATLLAQMVLANEVSLNDPVAKYLPSGVNAPYFESKPVTLLELAEQNSGFPRLPPNLALDNLANPYVAYTPKMLYGAVSHLQLSRPPGAQYEYSNFGVMLLGQLLANRAHESYAQLVTQRILQPLRMNDTVVTGTPASRKLMIQGYTVDGAPQQPWDFGTLGAFGSIESDLHDMILYLRANMDAPGGTLGSAMAFAQRPRVPGMPTMQIGLIWNTSMYGYTWHNGDTFGYHAFVAFSHEKHQGVVVLANVGDMNVIDLIGLHAIVQAVAVPASSPSR